MSDSWSPWPGSKEGHKMNADKTTQAKSKKSPKNSGEHETALLSDILPLPAPRFRGRIGNTYADSEADIISVPTAPAGAPNVLVILLDDVGFGQTSSPRLWIRQRAGGRSKASYHCIR